MCNLLFITFICVSCSCVYTRHWSNVMIRIRKYNGLNVNSISENQNDRCWEMNRVIAKIIDKCSSSPWQPCVALRLLPWQRWNSNINSKLLQHVAVHSAIHDATAVFLSRDGSMVGSVANSGLEAAWDQDPGSRTTTLT